MNEVTQILSGIEAGEPHAAERLLPLVYEELRKLAAQKMAEEKPGQTLQATALVHEAYLRLVDVKQAQHWNGRSGFDSQLHICKPCSRNGSSRNRTTSRPPCPWTSSDGTGSARLTTRS
jgi:hypothetical protein